MYPLSIFLLLLQVQVVQVSSFITQNQQQHVGFLDTLLQQQGQLKSISPFIATTLSTRQRRRRRLWLHAASMSSESAEEIGKKKEPRKISTYDLGVGKNLPVGFSVNDDDDNNATSSANIDQDNIQWNVPELPNSKKVHELRNSKKVHESLTKSISAKYSVSNEDENIQPRRVRRMVARTEDSSKLRGAIWHEEHYSADDERDETAPSSSSSSSPSISSTSTTNATNPEHYSMSLPTNSDEGDGSITKSELFYPNIDLSIPLSVYDPETSKDIVWDLMRWEAYQEAQREPLLVSFLYSSILNHDSLESSLAFLLANKLSSAAMISTQVQSLILGALYKDRSIGRAIRADIMVSGCSKK